MLTVGSMHEAERALFELRQGRPLLVAGTGIGAGDPGMLLATVENLTADTLELFRQYDATTLRVVVTPHRARAMGLANGEPARALSLRVRGETAPERIRHLCSAATTYAGEDLGVRPATRLEVGGLALARLGQFLPAVVGVQVRPEQCDTLNAVLAAGSILSVTTAQIESMAENVRATVTYVSEGPVPLADAEHARFMVFREANGLLEHVAVLIGDAERWPDPVPVRLHSACLTGDLFGSLRCDCGEQLRGSLRACASQGGGVILYLSQEGRMIGLGNKLRAYSLQHAGLDTVDADEMLGFGADERGYDAAVDMLRYLGVKRVQLLTNNPEKVNAVREAGIQVVDRRPLFGTLNRHNLRYVKAKSDRAGHWLDEMLAGGAVDK